MANPFVSNAPFLYPLKTSENLMIFCFQGVKKGCIGNEWVERTLLGIIIIIFSLNIEQKPILFCNVTKRLSISMRKYNYVTLKIS